MTHHRAARTFAVLFTLVAAIGAGTGLASAGDAPLAAPSNDMFASAITIPSAGGSVTGTNVEATKETGEPPHAQNVGGSSVWWTWTAPTAGTTSIHTVGSSYDTTLGVYTGTAVNALTLVKQDDESGGASTSAVVFQAVKDTTYRIAVDGWRDNVGVATGSVKLTVARQPSNGTLTVISPNGGESVTRGSNLNVAWSFNYPAVVTSAAADVPAGSNHTDELQAKAASSGPVRALVGLNVAVVPEGNLSGDAAHAQRKRIANGAAALDGDLAGSGARRLKAFQSVPFVVLEVPASAFDRIRRSPNVASVVEDVAVAPTMAASAPLVGADTANALGFTGAGQTVAILDTGVKSTHADFGNRVVAQDCYSANANCPGDATTATGAGAGEPCTYTGSCFHGTHVAGIAAGQGGDGTSPGIAPGASIHAFQVFSRFDSGCGTASVPCTKSFPSDQISAMERVLDQDIHPGNASGVREYASLNMSLGGQKYSSQATCDTDNAAEKAAIDNLRSVGIAVAIASGNDGWTDGISSPGCISTAISVGSTTKGDAVSSFSNSMPFVSLLAPGSSIVSANYSGGATSASGTSMATPHVAGTWAVLKQKVPAASVSSVLAALQATGVPITDTRAGANNLVRPRISVRQALEALVPKVKVEAVGPAGQVVVIAASVPVNNVAAGASADTPTTTTGNGAVTWAVPVGMAPGAWKVRVTSTVDPGLTDLSNATFNVQGPTSAKVIGDYTGDGLTDIAVYRPASGGNPGTWYIRNLPAVAWGSAGDVPVPADYNGDGLTDIAVYRPASGGNPGTWYIRNQSAVVWGSAGDVPVPGDYNGDGAADVAVFRPAANGNPGTWYIRNQSAVAWGSAGDIPVRGDFNGDGSTDIAVYRPGASASTWYIRNQSAVSWGRAADVPTPGDYNGDGTTDIAVYRPAAAGNPGTWYIRNQSPVAWGSAGDIPVRGDFNGDGSIDIAVYRPGASASTWYIRNQSAVSWGRATDTPTL